MADDGFQRSRDWTCVSNSGVLRGARPADDAAVLTIATKLTAERRTGIVEGRAEMLVEMKSVLVAQQDGAVAGQTALSAYQRHLLVLEHLYPSHPAHHLALGPVSIDPCAQKILG
jgi:hypothetical protein